MGLLAHCQILVVENGSCDGSEGLRTEKLNQLSRGELTPAELDALGDQQSMFRGFEAVLGKAVYKTGKTVVLENSPWGDEEGRKFLACLTVAPQAASVDAAVKLLRAKLDEAAVLVRRRDEAYANQLFELVRSDSASNVLAMMGSGHERTLAKYLRGKGVTFKPVTQPSSLPSTYGSIALERAENKEHLGRLDLLRCLAEFFPLRSFVPFGERGTLFMKFWIDKRSEAELTAYLAPIYRFGF